MKLGDKVYTPRFCTVKINAIFADENEARECGYYEPTHYNSDEYIIVGKHIGTNLMKFAAVHKALPQ
jgi:hypothetical protein